MAIIEFPAITELLKPSYTRKVIMQYEKETGIQVGPITPHFIEWYESYVEIIN